MGKSQRVDLIADRFAHGGIVVAQGRNRSASAGIEVPFAGINNQIGVLATDNLRLGDGQTSVNIWLMGGLLFVQLVQSRTTTDTLSRKRFGRGAQD